MRPEVHGWLTTACASLNLDNRPRWSFQWMLAGNGSVRSRAWALFMRYRGAVYQTWIPRDVESRPVRSARTHPVVVLTGDLRWAVASVN